MCADWTPEVVISSKDAVQLIENQFPNLHPVSIQQIGEGFDNTVFEVNQNYIFRFPRKQIAEDLLKIEKGLLPKLSTQLPISIPTPIMFGQPDYGYPWLFLGYPFIKGEVPGVIEDHIRADSVPLIAEFLKKLHSVSKDWAQQCGVPVDPIERLNITKRKPKLLANLTKAYEIGLLARDEKMSAFLRELERVEGVDFNRNTLVHGDLHIRNVLVDEDGMLSGIIDWGDTHIGHPAIDLAFVYTFFPKQARERFFNMYGEVHEYTHILARFFGVYVSVIQLLYGHDLQDHSLVEVAGDAIDRVIE
ncbi:phosphotransferase [Pontibacillus yanchengensis]|uniref:Phosphotransferase n=1 Tax=Pontibacillus yanchengensis Y32 TaxID=1385514 RepID=A0A0A2THY7_9BACI|nr:phosphotransferase [Pontibacillus yanchengensis]KGP74058.1 phosphotransferase [Pontibacillus yanchengensis Y32]